MDMQLKGVLIYLLTDADGMPQACSESGLQSMPADEIFSGSNLSARFQVSSGIILSDGRTFNKPDGGILSQQENFCFPLSLWTEPFFMTFSEPQRGQSGIAALFGAQALFTEFTTKSGENFQRPN